jgi:hypothetical protein
MAPAPSSARLPPGLGHGGGAVVMGGGLALKMDPTIELVAYIFLEGNQHREARLGNLLKDICWTAMQPRSTPK